MLEPQVTFLSDTTVPCFSFPTSPDSWHLGSFSGHQSVWGRNHALTTLYTSVAFGWPGTGLWAAHTHCERQYVLGSDERPCPQGRLDPNGGWGPWKRTREWECTAQQVDGLEFLPIRVSSRVGFHLVASSPGPSASPRWPSPSERKVSIRMVGRWLFWKTWPLPLCSRRFGRSLS